MKCIITVLILCVMLVPICKAESSTERFLSNLSDTWDSFLDMAEDAGKDATKWAEGSGVTEWAKGKANDIAVWAKENGLTDWAQETLSDLTAWFDETEITGWASNTSQEFQVFIEENRPAIEACLTEAGQEVREAWDTLVNADQHTEQEMEAAYETVMESLGEVMN
jgi:hypothetical protein